MTMLDTAALDRALNRLPLRFRGPGGVAGIVKDGKVVARRAWGFADMYRRLPMTAQTRLPICSISKQFTCALLLDQFGDPAALDDKVRDYLPDYRDRLPTIAELCHNQSGLRDYWALTVLHGAYPETEFRREDALPLIASAKTGHFPAGAHYSYSNGNFRILGELIERGTGRAYADLLRERLFAPAGMSTAVLSANTRVPVDGVVGYEGNDDTGFLPADNGIYWFGDAGIAASLDDMLAWECHIDATRDAPDGLYNRLSAPAFYADGTPATYAYGLRRDVYNGLEFTGHGGGLRGFSSYRMHVAAERLSVVVMFNHGASGFAAAAALADAALGRENRTETIPSTDWDGLWLDEAQGLIVRTSADAGGVKLWYGPSSALATVTADGVARGQGFSLRREDGHLVMERQSENLTVTARRLEPVEWVDATPIAGRYRSDELDAFMEIEVRDGAAFAVFEGLYGKGPMERMYALAQDVFVITSRRALDAAAPGDWTVLIQRDSGGAVTGLVVGCWLARGIVYRGVN
nr:D-aminopeptidase [uncultured Shinella sp.]